MSRIEKRNYYSLSHIQAAALFARLCRRIEEKYDGTWSEELFFEHQAYVTGSIFSAVSFLEATINEFFSDASEFPDKVKALDSGVRELIADIWRLGVPRTAAYPIVTKYAIALSLARRTPFSSGPPYEDVKLLVQLRNGLVHYEPEWVTTMAEDNPEDVTIQSFEKKLGGRFPLNPLRDEHDPFFPDRCLSHGCAEWAVVSSVKFVDEFWQKMNLPSHLNHIRLRLGTR